MKLLGIDYGKKKIGLAVADQELKVISPYGILEYKDEDIVISEIAEIYQKENIDKIIIGLPLSQEGEETSISLSVRVFAEKLSRVVDSPIEFESEVFTSSEARYRKEIDREYSKNIVETKVKIDSLSAVIILENYLSNHPE